MVGAPASGKTTFAQEMATKSGAAYISRDEIRYIVTKSRKIDMEKEKYVLKAFCEEIIRQLKFKDMTFADATHTSPRSRFAFYHEIRNAAKEQNLNPDDIDIIPVVMEVPFELCLERNAARSKEFQAPEEDMINYYAKCTYPSKTVPDIEIKCFPVRYFYNPNTNVLESIDFKDNIL